MINNNKIINTINKISVHTIPLFIILSTILFVFSLRQVYYHDIAELDLVSSSGYSQDTIKRNYDYLIDYTLSLKNVEFSLPDLPSSKNAIIHFQDVKNLIQVIIKLNFVFSFLSLWGIIYITKTKKYEYFKMISVNIFVIPIFLSIPFAVNFSKSFEIFHKIFFRNDYWLFDARYDPIITILPETFFFHAAVLILVLLTILSVIFFYLYHRFKNTIVYAKKGIKNE